MSKWLLLCALGTTWALSASARAEDKKDAPAALNFTMESLDGKKVDLSKYQGKVVLVVNTASECGLTPQYENLQKLYDEFGKDGLVVLGFPCNQFGKQEPGSAKEISEFCTKNYGVTFPMFAKVDVNGDNAAPLFKHLTAQKTEPEAAGPVKWNFGKFLLNKKGEVIARFEPKESPSGDKVVGAVKAELAKK